MQSLLIVPRSRPLACARGSLLPTVMCCLLSPGLLAAQASPEIREILDRIQRLEAQNRALADEVHQLRQELASAHGAATQPAPTLAEKVAVQESRTEELAQSKVGFLLKTAPLHDDHGRVQGGVGLSRISPNASM